MHIWNAPRRHCASNSHTLMKMAKFCAGDKFVPILSFLCIPLYDGAVNFNCRLQIFHIVGFDRYIKMFGFKVICICNIRMFFQCVLFYQSLTFFDESLYCIHFNIHDVVQHVIPPGQSLIISNIHCRILAFSMVYQPNATNLYD